MQPDRKDTQKEVKRSTFSKIEKMHPYKMLLYLVILGSGFIFLFLILAFNISQSVINNYDQFRFPRAFVVSTIVLLLSSFQMSKLLRYYNVDNIKGLIFTTGITIVLSLIFICLQYIGWVQLSSQESVFSGVPNDSYLLVIFGLHAFHFLAGLFFLVLTYYSLFRIPKDPICNLLLFTNPFEKMKLELIVAYWQFINVLWMSIFFYFLFSF